MVRRRRKKSGGLDSDKTFSPAGGKALKVLNVVWHGLIALLACAAGLSLTCVLVSVATLAVTQAINDAIDDNTAKPDDTKSTSPGDDQTQSPTETTSDQRGTKPGDDENGPGGESADGMCFVENTLVAVPSGYVPIGNIAPGKRVHAYNEATARCSVQAVVQHFRSDADALISLSFENEELMCTPAHRFFTGSWTAAGQLKPGVSVFSRAGHWKEVRAVKPRPFDGQVHNLFVEDDHTYFVGKSGLLVHNMKDRFPTGDDAF